MRRFRRFGAGAARLGARFAILGGLVWLARLAENPLVRLEATLGLSPGPLERLTGLPTLFSGMTAGVHRLAHGEVAAATAANFLTVPLALAVTGCILAGYRPRVRTRRQEAFALAGVVVLSLAVTLVHG